jgi:hypothetical protein
MTNEYERYDFWNRELKKVREDSIKYNADVETVLDNKANDIESTYAEDSSEEKKNAL